MVKLVAIKFEPPVDDLSGTLLHTDSDVFWLSNALYFLTEEVKHAENQGDLVVSPTADVALLRQQFQSLFRYFGEKIRHGELNISLHELDETREGTLSLKQISSVFDDVKAQMLKQATLTDDGGNDANAASTSFSWNTWIIFFFSPFLFLLRKIWSFQNNTPSFTSVALDEEAFSENNLARDSTSQMVSQFGSAEEPQEPDQNIPPKKILEEIETLKKKIAILNKKINILNQQVDENKETIAKCQQRLILDKMHLCDQQIKLPGYAVDQPNHYI